MSDVDDRTDVFDPRETATGRQITATAAITDCSLCVLNISSQRPVQGVFSLDLIAKSRRHRGT